MNDYTEIYYSANKNNRHFGRWFYVSTMDGMNSKQNCQNFQSL